MTRTVDGQASNLGADAVAVAARFRCVCTLRCVLLVLLWIARPTAWLP